MDWDDLFESPDWAKDDEDEDDDDVGAAGGGTGNQWNVSDQGIATHYLMLLDCHPDMWKENPALNGKSAFASTLSFIEDWMAFQMQDSAMYHTGKRNGVAVMLYNTQYRAQKDTSFFEQQEEYLKDPDSINKPSNEAEGEEDEEEDENPYANDPNRKTTVHELIPMAPPGVSTVKTIRKALEQEEELKNDYAAENGNDGSFNGVCLLQIALQDGLQMLRSCKTVKTKSTPSSPKKDRIQIWIWTTQENPAQSGQLKRALLDINEDNEGNPGLINVALFGLPSVRTAKLFDYSIFYDSLSLQTADEEEEENDDNDDDDDSANHLLQMPLKGRTEDEMRDFSIARELYKYSKPKRALYKRIPILLPDWKQHQAQLQQEQEQQQSQTDETKAAVASGEDAPLPDPRESSAYWMDFYRLVQTSKKPNLVRLSQSTGKKVESLTQWVLAGGSQEIISQRITNSKHYQPQNNMSWALRTFAKLGKDRVSLTPEDVKTVKKVSNTNSEFAGLILQGFRPLDSISELLMIAQSYVVVPTAKANLVADTANKSQVQNHLQNQKALSSLCQAMREEKVVAFGEFLPRTTATSRMLALWPLPKYIFGPPEKASDEEGEEEEEDEEYLWPETGFLAVELPFNDEVRDIRDREGDDIETRVSEELEEIATKLVDKLTFKDEDAMIGQTFTNAHLDEYWQYVDEIALAKQIDPNRENKQYDTIIDDADFEHVQDVISEFQSLLPEVETASVKRTAKRKAEAAPDTSGLDWMQLLRDDELKKCRVPELKNKLKSYGEPVSGLKKADLLERVEEKLLEEYNRNLQTSAAVKEEPF